METLTTQGETGFYQAEEVPISATIHESDWNDIQNLPSESFTRNQKIKDVIGENITIDSGVAFIKVVESGNDKEGKVKKVSTEESIFLLEID